MSLMKIKNNVKVPHTLALDFDKYLTSISQINRAGLLFGYSLSLDSFVIAGINSQNQTKALAIPDINKAFRELSVSEIITNTHRLFSSNFDLDAAYDFDWSSLDAISKARYQEIALSLSFVQDALLERLALIPIDDIQFDILSKFAFDNRQLALALGSKYVQKLELSGLCAQTLIQKAPSPISTWLNFSIPTGKSLHESSYSSPTKH